MRAPDGAGFATADVRAARLQRIAPAVVALALLVAGPRLDVRTDVGSAAPRAVHGLPVVPGCSVSRDEAWDVPRPRLVGASESVSAAFACASGRVIVDIARYGVQAPGREAVGGANQLVDIERMSKPTPRTTTTGAGFDALAYDYDRKSEGVTVWTWYAVAGVGEPTATDAKLRELRHAILRQSPESAVFVLTAIGGDEEARAHRLEQATRAVWDWYRFKVFPQ